MCMYVYIIQKCWLKSSAIRQQMPFSAQMENTSSVKLYKSIILSYTATISPLFCFTGTTAPQLHAMASTLPTARLAPFPTAHLNGARRLTFLAGG